MKVIGKGIKSKLVKYGDVEPGQCFTIYGRIEIKGDWRDDSGSYVSINIATGSVYGGSDDLLVEPITVEAHIIEEKK